MSILIMLGIFGKNIIGIKNKIAPSVEMGLKIKTQMWLSFHYNQ
jgi:hypothetical protein